MLGVRLREGLPLTALPAAAPARRAVARGLPSGRARPGPAVLTQRGRLLADAVVRDLLAERPVGLLDPAPVGHELLGPGSTRC